MIVASKSWIISATLLVGCSGMNVADAFLPISGIAGIGFFHQAKRMGGFREFIPRQDFKHMNRFHSTVGAAMDTTVRMAEDAALMSEPLTSATTRFLMDRVGDGHHRLLDKTIGEIKEESQFSDKTIGESKAENSIKMTLSHDEDVTNLSASVMDKSSIRELKAEKIMKVAFTDDDDVTKMSASASTETLTSATGRFLLDRLEDAQTPQLQVKTIGELKAEKSAKEKNNDKPGMSSTTSTRDVSEDVWGDNGLSIEVAAEKFQKDLQTAKKGSAKEKEKQGSSSVLTNASLGLTAPMDLLKGSELKHREEEMTMADEGAQKRARIAQEQSEIRELMKHIQHGRK